MTPAKLSHHRLHSQRLIAPTLPSPADVVRWFGAVQAQEYAGALWALGLRTRGATEASVAQAVADGAIVRTWPMRGTLHFVPAEDVRWMLELTAARQASYATARLEREFGLDGKELARSAKVVVGALEGGRRLTREALYRVLELGGVPAGKGRGLHIVWGLAHAGLICYGPREGRQPTVVLLEEWAPTQRRLSREAALAELALRYFRSHGPATLHDFIWWSSLRVRDATEGLALVKADLPSVELGGRTYYGGPTGAAKRRPSPWAQLLPPFDEYTVAYRDRTAVLSPAQLHRVRGMQLLGPTIVLNGRVVGYWRRHTVEGAVGISLAPFTRLDPTARRAIDAATRRYTSFLGAPADAA
jgi:hypothetical protein